MKKHIYIALVLCICFSCKTGNVAPLKTEKPKLIPSFFDDGDRIYLNLQLKNNREMTAFADTGGGWTIIYPWAVDSLGLRTFVKDGENNGNSTEMPLDFILSQDLFQDADFYPLVPKGSAGFGSSSKFLIPPIQMVEGSGINPSSKEHAFLGQHFFLNHSWTFDYIHKTVHINPNKTIDTKHPNVQKIGLKKDTTGTIVSGHPSFFATIDGEKIPFLFDTGATFHLSENAQQRLKRKEKIGGSFIAHSVYEKWKQKHPEWSIIKGGDKVPVRGRIFDTDMIQVPEVTLGQITVGPIWFSVRPDSAWSKGMAQTMDKEVKGAIGGSALKYVSVCIDYPNQLILFMN